MECFLYYTICCTGWTLVPQMPGGGREEIIDIVPYWCEIHISLRASNMALYHHNWRYSTWLQFYRIPLLSTNSELYICKHGKVLCTVYAFYLRVLYVVEFTLCYNIHAIPIIIFLEHQEKDLKKTFPKASECYRLIWHITSLMSSWTWTR